MRIILVTAILCSAVAYVLALSCHHDDLSGCTGINCTNPHEVVGCEHDVCTCVPSATGPACTDIADCVSFTCSKNDEKPHCMDGSCKCIKEH